MDKLDEQIRDALEGAANVREFNQPQSIVDDITGTFQSKHRTLLYTATVEMILASLLWIFSIYQFFQHGSIESQLLWATLTILCTVIIAADYTMFWISLNKHVTNREVKKLELQIALLIHKLDSQNKEHN